MSSSEHPHSDDLLSDPSQPSEPPRDVWDLLPHAEPAHDPLNTSQTETPHDGWDLLPIAKSNPDAAIVEPIEEAPQAVDSLEVSHAHTPLTREQRDRWWQTLINLCTDKDVSDIHFIPSTNDVSVTIHKHTKTILTLSKENFNALIFDHLNEANQHALLKTNQGHVDYSLELFGRRLRCNTAKALGGFLSVYRPLPEKAIPWQDNELSPEFLEAFKKIKSGIIIIAGKTGSGKSTTLCSLLEYINNTRDEVILTLEDPIEYVFTQKRCKICQRELSAHFATFEEGLSATLRERVHYILLGEIRDKETAIAAMQMANSGHIVLTTIHANSVPDIIARLSAMNPDQAELTRHNLSETLQIAIYQDLVPKLSGGLYPAREILIVDHTIKPLIYGRQEHQLPETIRRSKGGMLAWNTCLQNALQNRIISQATYNEYRKDH